MKQYILNVGITIVVTILTLLGVYNFLPVSIFDPLVSEKTLGTSITTIQGTDTIKNSRTTINDNFTVLNNGKIETSTTSLPLITTLSGLTTAGSLSTIGNITSGTWNGTTIAVNKGGTGATSFTAYGLLMGNGFSSLSVVGTGTDGQLLTYSSTTTPYWSSPTIDTAINYNWTGTHTFSTSTFNIFPTIPSGTPTNGASAISIGYATSTFETLANSISFKAATSTAFSISGSSGAEYGTTTLYAIPANTLTGKKALKIKIFGASASTGGKIDIKLGNVIISTLTLNNTSGSQTIYLFAYNSASAQRAFTETTMVAPSYTFGSSDYTVDMTAAVNLNAVLYTAGASNATNIQMSSVEFVNN